MKKLFLSIIVLMLSISAWAQETQTVNYIDANGQKQTVTATKVTDETNTLSSGWYVVLGNDVQTGSLTCNGAVHLILADGAKLTATGGEGQAGILVSGNGNSLVIYGQDLNSGNLIAKGGPRAAGIGGIQYSLVNNISGEGSNITINGGTVSATGGNFASGIGGGENGNGFNIVVNGGKVTAQGGTCGAGMGGGHTGNGSNITINGGTVSATGGDNASGIGGGNKGDGSNITINGGMVTVNGGKDASGIGSGYDSDNSSNITAASNFTVKADNNNPPHEEIEHTTNQDITYNLKGKRYVMIYESILSIKTKAIAEIDAKIEGITNVDIQATANKAKNDINNATFQDDINPIINAIKIQDDINAIKIQALDLLSILVKCHNSTKVELLGPLGTEQLGPAVKVTKDDTEVILYLPDKVEYIIRK